MSARRSATEDKPSRLEAANHRLDILIKALSIFAARDRELEGQR